MNRAHTHTHTQGGPLVTTFTHHSASARCTPRGPRLCIDYSGVITLRAIAALDRCVLPLRRDADLVIENFERAITFLDEPPPVNRKLWPGWSPPSMAIVRPEQMSASLLFCQDLRAYEISRATFLATQQALIEVWARSIVLQAKSRRRPPKSSACAAPAALHPAAVPA